MATRKEFCDAVIADYENHSVYIGTGNGELVEKLTIEKIHKMEETYARRDSKGKPLWNSDTRRDLAFIGKCYEQGFDMSKASAEDCSGLAVHGLRETGVIKPTADYNCRTFQQACKEVPLKDVQPADFVFDKKQQGDKSTAGHMGVVTSIENGIPYVIESRGRDYGVVKRKLSEGNWAVGGRLDWFDDEIPILTRELKYVEGNLMHGQDVKQCQERLVLKGYNPGLIDGYYGHKTEDAVIEFQVTSENLNVKRLGVVGQKTWNALWEK